MMELLDLDTRGVHPRILLVCGSPRSGGNTETLLARTHKAAEQAGATVDTFYLSEGEVSPCLACEACFATGECVISDRMGEFFDLADAADVLVIATPVYWACVPAQLKAVYDRFQSRWARYYLLGEPRPPKRPVHLFITGTGKDPHGYEPLIGTSRSALAVLGFTLSSINDFIGFERDGTDASHQEALEIAAGLGVQFAERP